MGKISFFLMSLKGFNTLTAFIEALGRKNIDIVVSAKDSNVEKDYYSEIEMLCREFEIPFCNRTEKFEVKSSYALAISWRWLVDLSDTRLIVFHDSILPKYRGFAPLVTSLINGEDE